MSGITIEELIDNISKNNGLSKKVTQRFINNLIKNKSAVDDVIQNLQSLKNNFSICEICNYYKIKDVCLICKDPTRNQNMICVISNQLDVYKIEQNKQYHGLYHVLENEINLNNNSSPKDIGFEKLKSRIDDSKEIILALNATFEGELTANYIYQELKKHNVNITRIAKGIPMGGSLDYMDESTLTNAFKNRKKYEG